MEEIIGSGLNTSSSSYSCEAHSEERQLDSPSSKESEDGSSLSTGIFRKSVVARRRKDLGVLPWALLGVASSEPAAEPPPSS